MRELPGQLARPAPPPLQHIRPVLNQAPRRLAADSPVPRRAQVAQQQLDAPPGPLAAETRYRSARLGTGGLPRGTPGTPKRSARTLPAALADRPGMWRGRRARSGRSAAVGRGRPDRLHRAAPWHGPHDAEPPGRRRVSHVGHPIRAFAEHRDDISLALVVGHHHRERGGAAAATAWHLEGVQAVRREPARRDGPPDSVQDSRHAIRAAAGVHPPVEAVRVGSPRHQPGTDEPLPADGSVFTRRFLCSKRVPWPPTRAACQSGKPTHEPGKPPTADA